ncbi:hypothetical protein WR164_01790 [Philodulcilactobacillus myokoensis]|uniref:Uncharacterized protein n=1 Tax=Philodulcilactobacillus myokoensis TaxID=2929573 RepID=A0A9W6B094_9LACO|nr:hypothetical protein [Philodulcilactobacillus myokoensis]GLB46200.1 hypothetical protein WR164_01790 [Philodulcilactobacillus myokoensis]
MKDSTLNDQIYNFISDSDIKGTGVKLMDIVNHFPTHSSDSIRGCVNMMTQRSLLSRVSRATYSVTNHKNIMPSDLLLKELKNDFHKYSIGMDKCLSLPSNEQERYKKIMNDLKKLVDKYDEKGGNKL